MSDESAADATAKKYPHIKELRPTHFTQHLFGDWVAWPESISISRDVLRERALSPAMVDGCPRVTIKGITFYALRFGNVCSWYVDRGWL